MRLFKIALTLILAAGIVWLIQPVRSSAAPDSDTGLPPAILLKLHPALARQLLSGEGAPVRVQIVMRDQAAPQSLLTLNRAAWVANLQTRAEQSQADVRAILTAQHATDVRSLWINNSLAASLERATVLAVAARDEVALIKPDEFRQWIDPAELANPTSTRSVQSPTSIEWGLTQIRADQVWSALNITGTGVVVANLDTGVDWQHPALHDNYRGLGAKGLVNHAGSWIDTTDEGTLYPVDGFGHGTHTMGTLAGQDGIGVAPGAKWIAARVLDTQGYGLDSWIHAGFQWMLAPAGDSANAPDILSNSWGSTYGANEEFRPDVQLLNAAGIFTVFSNGNSGPAADTVDSPASFPEAFSIGATDRYDTLATFSSRGPSPFGVLKPEVSAPGVEVRSSLPGGVYARGSGTSMAAPHAAGAAALMYSAAPGLTITAARFALTSTATRPTTDTYPNNLYGWGRIDAYRAVLAVAHPGTLSGTLTRRDSGAPIAGGTVQAQSEAGTLATIAADAQGRYQLPLPAAHYTVTAAAFSYAPQTQANLIVLTDTVTPLNFVLTPQPIGLVEGRLLDLTGTRLLSGTLSVVGAPISLAVSSGAYSLILPVGSHVLEVRAARQRVVTASITVDPGQRVAQDFHLPDAPTILLVDSGRWYNGSGERFYRQALTDLHYLYDEWPILDPGRDVPTTTTLRAYDTVIWSSPLDSPGYVDAGSVISDYLDGGGHLLLSGQDVGYYDAYLPYFWQQLFAQFVADDGPSRALTGTGWYAGSAVSIEAGDGADNQSFPDVIQSLSPHSTENAFNYAADQSGGQTVGVCQPYRAAYFAFGFEAINDRLTRADVLSRTFALLGRAPSRQAYELDAGDELLIGLPGTIVTRTLTLYNFDEVTAHTALSIAADSAWPIDLTPTHIDSRSCTTHTVILTATIPLSLPIGATAPIVIRTSPSFAPEAADVVTLTAKAPGAVLLVDDARWYPVDAAYRAGLEANRVPYDVWRVPTNWSGFEPDAPTLARLRWYPAAIWFTGYDWYQTLTDNNEAALRQFAAEGGRWALSSQDYLSERGFNAFGREVLGVLDFAEDVVTTQASGPRGSRFDGLNRAPLSWPYRNYSDALAPQPDAQVELLGQHGWPIALTHDYGAGRVLFMAVGFEGFASAQRRQAMQGVISALSWLGSSRVQFDRAVAAIGDPLTVTIRAINDGPRPIDHAAFTATLPIGLAGPDDAALAWHGSLRPGEAVTRTFAVTVTAGGAISLPVIFEDADHQLAFTSLVPIAVDRPALELKLSPVAPTSVGGGVMTWTLAARNLGADWPAGQISGRLPFDQLALGDLVTATLGAATHYSGTITWQGALLAGQSVTLTYQMTVPFVLDNQLLYGDAAVLDDAGVWQTGAWLPVQPRRVYLPVVRK
jgi:subtilisin family serine protease